jgi:tetratricopeptide (TPR) repeat protein
LTGVDAWGHGRVAEANEILQRAMQLVADAPPAKVALEDEQRFVMRCFWNFYRALHGDASLTDVFADYSLMHELATDRFAETSVAAFAATSALTLGDWAWTRHFNDLVQRADPDGQFAFWNGNALMTRGILAAVNGDLDRAIADFERGRNTYTDVGGHSGQPMFAATLALNLAARGATQDAARYVAEARAVLDERGELWNAPVVLLAEGVLADELGDRSGAAAALASAVAVAREQGSIALADRVTAVASDRGLALDDADAGV